MRNSAKVAIATTFALATAACAGGTAEDETAGAQETGANDEAPAELVVTSFGGDWEAAFVEAVVEPFEQEHNAEVSLVTAYSADALAQMTAQEGNAQYDVVHFSGGQETQAAQEGMLAPIAPEDLSNYDDLASVAVAGMENGEGPVMQISPIGIMYRTDMIDSAPTSWEAIFDPAYAEHVALTDLSNSYGLLSLLAINDTLGGDLTNVEPGMTALTDLVSSGDAIVVETSSEIQQAFSARDIWIAPYSQDYAETLRQADLPVDFVVPEEGAPASYITANAVAGGGNVELAKEFIDYELRPEVQREFAEALLYSPTNLETELPDELAEVVVHGEELESLVRYDNEVINENRAEWTDEWNSSIAR